MSPSPTQKKTPPPSVFKVMRELVASKLVENKAIVTQEEAVNAISKKLKCSKAAVVTRHYLEIEDVFRQEGWDVKYRKPGFNEKFEANFRFKKRSLEEPAKAKAPAVNCAKLLKAVRELYKAGKWECNTLPAKVQVKLWTQLRDAAQIQVGTATKLGVGAGIE